MTSIEERKLELTNHVTVASDLPSKALDGSSHLVYLAVVTSHCQGNDN